MSNSQFHYTKVVFSNYLNYTTPYSYDEWMQLPYDDKAAALFVQFYDQIWLAWQKSYSPYRNAEDGVECIIQYLQKNVDKIINDKKRFTKRYIYRVAYNCLEIVCNEYVGEKRRYESEISNNQTDLNGKPLDLFNFVGFSDNCMDWYLEESKNIFWNIIESYNDCKEFQEYVDRISGPGIDTNINHVRLNQNKKIELNLKLKEIIQTIPQEIISQFI